MKKIFLFLAGGMSFVAYSQFSVRLSVNNEFAPTKAYFYKVEGSKDVLVQKLERKNNSWLFSYNKPYSGMMKIYFENNASPVHFVSENKNVEIQLNHQGKSYELTFADETNKAMQNYQELQAKKQNILPVLVQMQNFYQPSSDFRKAIDKEISHLSGQNQMATKSHFISFLRDTEYHYLDEAKTVSQAELQNFIVNADKMLDNSGLLRSLLMRYLKQANHFVEGDMDQLLEKANIQTARGQLILAEIIDIFDTYGMEDLKKKYLSQALNLKKNVSERLSKTISVNKNTEIGAIAPDHTFVNVINTNAKTLHSIKANKKVLAFWTTTCSHCEREIPQFIPHYKSLKDKGIEIIGFSLDNEKLAYETRVKDFPWVNEAELNGWRSSYVDKYNIHGTPTYFILDENNKIISKPNGINEVFRELGIK